jgi:hypothetical protein
MTSRRTFIGQLVAALVAANLPNLPLAATGMSEVEQLKALSASIVNRKSYRLFWQTAARLFKEANSSPELFEKIWPTLVAVTKSRARTWMAPSEMAAFYAELDRRQVLPELAFIDRKPLTDGSLTAIRRSYVKGIDANGRPAEPPPTSYELWVRERDGSFRNGVAEFSTEHELLAALEAVGLAAATVDEALALIKRYPQR